MKTYELYLNKFSYCLYDLNDMSKTKVYAKNTPVVQVYKDLEKPCNLKIVTEAGRETTKVIK